MYGYIKLSMDYTLVYMFQIYGWWLRNLNLCVSAAGCAGLVAMLSGETADCRGG